jgi:hypothetical protein
LVFAAALLRIKRTESDKSSKNSSNTKDSHSHA